MLNPRPANNFISVIAELKFVNWYMTCLILLVYIFYTYCFHCLIKLMPVQPARNFTSAQQLHWSSRGLNVTVQLCGVGWRTLLSLNYHYYPCMVFLTPSPSSKGHFLSWIPCLYLHPPLYLPFAELAYIHIVQNIRRTKLCDFHVLIRKFFFRKLS